jgi:hypothetical protein
MFPEDANDQIVAYAIKNLASLTIEGVHNLIVSKVMIPRLVAVWQKDLSAAAGKTEGNQDNNPADDNDTVLRSFPCAHRPESMSLITTWQLMRMLGFDHDSRKRASTLMAISMNVRMLWLTVTPFVGDT